MVAETTVPAIYRHIEANSDDIGGRSAPNSLATLASARSKDIIKLYSL